jgi:DNA-binding NtrC family response regulator
MSDRQQVMVVDDDLGMCGVLRTFLGTRGYSALAVTNADEAVRRFHSDRPDAVLLDVVMPGGMDGLAALAAFKRIDKDVPIIVISGQGCTTTVVQAMKLGAADFLCKPFENSELEMLLTGALKQRHLSREVATLREQLTEQSRYTMLFGNGTSMREVRELIERVSDTDVTVLIRARAAPARNWWRVRFTSGRCAAAGRS